MPSTVEIMKSTEVFLCTASGCLCVISCVRRAMLSTFKVAESLSSPAASPESNMTNQVSPADKPRGRDADSASATEEEMKS